MAAPAEAWGDPIPKGAHDDIDDDCTAESIETMAPMTHDRIDDRRVRLEARLQQTKERLARWCAKIEKIVAEKAQSDDEPAQVETSPDERVDVDLDGDEPRAE